MTRSESQAKKPGFQVVRRSSNQSFVNENRQISCLSGRRCVGAVYFSCFVSETVDRFFAGEYCKIILLNIDEESLRFKRKNYEDYTIF